MPVMLGLVGALVCYVLFSGVFDVSPTEVSLLVTGDPTFTGRTDLWTFAVGKIAGAVGTSLVFGLAWFAARALIAKPQASDVMPASS